MKCRSPFSWILHCLKSAWRLVCGKKRTNDSPTGGFAGITVDSASRTEIQRNELCTWAANFEAEFSGAVHSPSPTDASPFLPVNPVKYSATEAWRESVVKQKTAPPPAPETEEEPNFFDNMEPSFRKPKTVRLWNETENSSQDQSVSSRLAFKAQAVPNLKAELDWMEETEGAASWEAAIDELDPRAAKKAKRKVAKDQAVTLSSNQQVQDTRVRKQMV